MSNILPNAVGERKHNLSHSVNEGGYPTWVPNLDQKAVLWANVSALMRHQWGAENLSRLSREAGIALASCTRIKEQKTSIGLDVLGRIADCFHLQPWHMLVPGLDPANPPVIVLSKGEAAFYAKLKEATRLAKDEWLE